MATRYQLLLCDISGEHKFIAVFESNSPFPCVAVGQRFDDHGWDRLHGVGIIASEEKPIRYTIHSIKTTIFIKDGFLVCQTGLNLARYQGDRSPAFGNTQPTMTTEEAFGRNGDKNT